MPLRAPEHARHVHQQRGRRGDLHAPTSTATRWPTHAARPAPSRPRPLARRPEHGGRRALRHAPCRRQWRSRASVAIRRRSIASAAVSRATWPRTRSMSRWPACRAGGGGAREHAASLGDHLHGPPRRDGPPGAGEPGPGLHRPHPAAVASGDSAITGAPVPALGWRRPEAHGESVRISRISRRLSRGIRLALREVGRSAR